MTVCEMMMMVVVVVAREQHLSVHAHRVLFPPKLPTFLFILLNFIP